MAGNKYIDIDSDQKTKWKEKYLSNLEELEIKEQQWQESEKILRALISHLTNAADTSSAKLSQQLEILRGAINKGVAANKLKRAIDEVADSILGLDAIREKKKRESKNQLVDLIGKIKPAGKIESKLAKISEKINKTSSNKEIAPLINELAKLFVYGLSLPEKNKDKGLLSSFISKKEKDDKPELQAATDSQSKITEVGLNLDKAVESLISLLEKMILPADLQVEANLIKRKLSQSVNEDIFLISLDKTIGITSDILSRIKQEKKEIEELLKQLTDRLHELDNDIRETARIKE